MKILIVDDDVISRKMLRAIMSSYGHCDLAASGSEALDCIEQAIREKYQYDIIMLDIDMPDASGQVVLTKIRALEEANGIFGLDQVKIIMATSMHDSRSIMTAFNNGCEGYITKPYDVVRIDKKLRELFTAELPQPKIPGMPNEHHHSGKSQKLSWSNSFSVGVELIDNQHKHLFEILNSIPETHDPVALSKTYLELQKDTRKHFADEEKMMREIKYPKLEEHTKLHEELAESLENFMTENNLSDPEAAAGLKNFICQWIVEHILFHDRDYFLFVNRPH